MRVRRAARAAVVVVLALVSLVASSAAPSASAADDDLEVLVIGVPGLRWGQVDAERTPMLARLAGEASLGALSTRTAAEASCPDAAWLTLGAGGRARGDSSCSDPEPESFSDLVARNRGNPDRTRVGALAEAIAAGGGCIDATGPGAELVTLAPSDRSIDGEGCRLHVLGLPPVRSAADLQAADRATGAAIQSLPRGARWLVLGVGEAGLGEDAHLHVAMYGGAGAQPGSSLRSASTGRSPYVQLIDVAPTVLEWLALPVPQDMAGRAISVTGHTGVERLADLDRRARGQRDAVFGFTAVVVAALILLVGATVQRARSVPVRGAALVMLAVPAASFLAQLARWWRGPVPVLLLLLAAAAIALALAHTASTLRPLIRPTTTVAAFTAALLAIDVATGSRLQMDAVFGYSPYVAGRFHGFGNPAFALFGTAALLTAVAAGRRWGPRAVVVVGVIAVIVDGAPFLGDDFGGVLALVPAFAVLAGLLGEGRLRWRRLAASGALAVLVVTGFALADYARGAAHRTHLGRFVEQVRDGSAGSVISRKAHANLDLLLHSPFTAVVPLLVVGAALLLLRPPPRLAAVFQSRPDARAGLLAVLTLSLVGGLVNDSGVAVPALALLLAVPYAVLAAAGEDGPRPDPTPAGVSDPRAAEPA